MTIFVTGHRPNKLWGYDILTGKYEYLMNIFKQMLIAYKVDKVVDGMALGTDMVMALTVISLKREGYDIKLHCAIPCNNHKNSKWSERDKIIYDYILKHADIVKLVTDEKYSPYLMMVRNKYMVDISDRGIAVWDGSKGGTANCVRYAQKIGKPLDIINPAFIGDGINV